MSSFFPSRSNITERYEIEIAFSLRLRQPLLYPRLGLLYHSKYKALLLGEMATLEIIST